MVYQFAIYLYSNKTGRISFKKQYNVFELFFVELVILKEGGLKPNRSYVTVYWNQRTETRHVRMQGSYSIKIFYEILWFLP